MMRLPCFFEQKSEILFKISLNKEANRFSNLVRLPCHVTDHYFYNKKKNEHYLIELKAGGDLDNKKAKSEKLALLQEYFTLKNFLHENKEEKGKIFIYLGTAYNMFGEGNYWKQDRVRQFFANEELLIGKDYWNFVCDDDAGFEIIMRQIKLTLNYLNDNFFISSSY